MAIASLPAESIAQVPRAIDAPDMTIAAITHAEGVQIYECDFNASRKLVWRFREPVASLISNGNTIGRHYAGPNWEHVDGSAVTAKVAGSSPGTRPDDIPWLRLDVTATRGSGLFSRVSVVQRINTQGGILSGDCEEAGSHRSIVYSADYVFLRSN